MDTSEVVKPMGKSKSRWVGAFALALAFLLSAAAAAQERTGAWVDEVIASEDPSAASAISRLEAGQIALYVFNVSDPELYSRLVQSDALGFERTYGSFTELTFNPVGPVFPGTGKLNPFAVPRVREAMNWLIDREYIAEELVGGMAVPRYFPLTTSFPDYARYAHIARRLEMKYAPDMAKAEAIISEEMERLGAVKVNGKWHYNGEPVTIIVLIRQEDERRAIGDYVANQLEAIGFTVDRQYKTAAEASPIWTQRDPADGLFHIYTGGWSSTIIARDQGGNFDFYYTKRGLAFPLWQAYEPTPQFDEVSDRLARNDFSTVEEREQLFEQALELAMEDSVRIWLVDRLSVIPRRAEVSVAADLASGVSGTFLWAHTIRLGEQVGGSLSMAMPSILPEPWNPLNGSNWLFDQMLIRGTSDTGAIADPYTGLPLPQRIERAEVYIKEGLPVTKNLDWVELHFVDEIAVPEDAWVDWDAEQQRFITAGEKFPDGLTALRKSVVYYPDDLFEHRWHDGSRLSVADFVMGMILTFDRAKPESPVFDESQVPTLNSFLSSFRGVRIVSTEPLIIETYSNQYSLDAELNVSAWFPTYAQGPGPWHTLALGLRAEAAQEAAFTTAKATKLGVEWLNYIAGPTLQTLRRHLEDATAESYVPYAPTMRRYTTALEIAERWRNLNRWYSEKGHFWVGSGPFYLERAYPVESIVHLKRFADYRDPAGKWSRFQAPRIADVDVSGPRRITSGQAATFDVHVSYAGEPYPVDDVTGVSYLVFDATGELALVGSAQPVEDGLWRVQLSAEETGSLPVGSNQIEVVVAPSVVSIPTFASYQFVSVP